MTDLWLLKIGKNQCEASLSIISGYPYICILEHHWSPAYWRMVVVGNFELTLRVAGTIFHEMGVPALASSVLVGV